jgi:hypothetical protein
LPLIGAHSFQHRLRALGPLQLQPPARKPKPRAFVFVTWALLTTAIVLQPLRLLPQTTSVVWSETLSCVAISTLAILAWALGRER